MQVKKKEKRFIREKKIYCGRNYLEVDIIPLSIQRKGRGKRHRASTKAQENLNEKNAKRRFVQIGNTNFGKGDLCVDCTYADEFLPDTTKEAFRDLDNMIKRIKYHMAKMNKELKYMAVTEYSTEDGEDGPDEPDERSKPVRVHHHLIINGGLDRDFVESLWSMKVKGKKERVGLGYCNADRLQPNENGIEARCNYMQKRKKGCKRYRCSQNLKKPVVRKNDSKYSFKKIREMRKTPEAKEYWRRQFPGYEPSRIEWVYNDYTGWSVYVKLRRVEVWKKEKAEGRI